MGKDKVFWAKVRELGGWKDGDMIRFPFPYAKDLFIEWCEEHQENSSDSYADEYVVFPDHK